MTERETGGPGGERRTVQLANARVTDGAGVGKELVVRAELPLPDRTVIATGCGAGVLTMQQSFLSPRLEGAGVCLQQPCCWGMGVAIQATTGARNKSINNALVARRCAELSIGQKNNTTKFRPLVCDRRHSVSAPLTGGGKGENPPRIDLRPRAH